MLTLDEKKVRVEDLHEKLKKATIVILAEYKGLKVETVNDLRRKLKEAGAEYQVVKNTILKRAAENTDTSVAGDYYKGPTAVVMSYGDPVASAKILSEFVASNENMTIKIGAMNGSLLTVEKIIALSKLPSREVLLSQLLSVLIGVPTGLVRVLNAVPGKLVNVLTAIKDKKEAA
ncbi:MAG: 50S ribosomal protein L10 [Thermodesulfobacteriota bacterium]